MWLLPAPAAPCGWLWLWLRLLVPYAAPTASPLDSIVHRLNKHSARTDCEVPDTHHTSYNTMWPVHDCHNAELPSITGCRKSYLQHVTSNYPLVWCCKQNVKQVHSCRNNTHLILSTLPPPLATHTHTYIHKFAALGNIQYMSNACQYLTSRGDMRAAPPYKPPRFAWCTALGGRVSLTDRNAMNSERVRTRVPASTY